MVALGIDVGGSSVKLAAIERGEALWVSQSETYQNPSRAELVAAIADSLDGHALKPGVVGICVPGRRDRVRRMVTQSVNVPSLNGLVLDDLVAQALGARAEHLTIASDAIANGYDVYVSNNLHGRLLALAMGTGVGAAVFDEGVPLIVDGESPGHIGQADVSIEGEPVIGPDGGAGTLEGYMGVPALIKKYEADIPTILNRLGPDDAAIKALVRAIRICHAIYVPDHVALTGGLGIRMGHLLPMIRKLVEKDLTSIARPGWTFITGKDDFHAARGIARMAIAGDSRES